MFAVSEPAPTPNTRLIHNHRARLGKRLIPEINTGSGIWLPILIAKNRKAVTLLIDRVYSGAPCLVRLFWTNHVPRTHMGRSYWFECAKCGYRAIVAGRADRGLDLGIQTILCRDCKQLYDAVTRLRIAVEPGPLWESKLQKAGLGKPAPALTTPPTFQSALNRLPPKGARRFRWLRFKVQCPLSALHRVRVWNDPDRCPKCGVFLEKSALPYRLWD